MSRELNRALRQFPEIDPDTESKLSRQAGINSLWLNRDPAIREAWRSDQGRSIIRVFDKSPYISEITPVPKLLKYTAYGINLAVGIKLAHSFFPLIEPYLP